MLLGTFSWIEAWARPARVRLSITYEEIPHYGFLAGMAEQKISLSESRHRKKNKEQHKYFYEQSSSAHRRRREKERNVLIIAIVRISPPSHPFGIDWIHGSGPRGDAVRGRQNPPTGLLLPAALRGVRRDDDTQWHDRVRLSDGVDRSETKGIDDDCARQQRRYHLHFGVDIQE